MRQLSTLSTALFFTAISMLYSCKKADIIPATEKNEEAISNLSDRATFTNYNRKLTFYALASGNRLDMYTTSIPKRVLNSVSISGLQTEESILSIDFRPATGQLYGLGSSSRIYVINPSTGVARAIGAGPFTPAINGNVTAFDFNPTVDRIRIITSSGQNLRANPETGTIVAIDGNINGQPGAIISGAAYINNFAGATTTALYDIDKESNNLYIQNPPNNGTLALVGPLGIDIEDGGFDIAGEADAFGLFQVNGRTSLISIDLSTGTSNIIVTYPQTVNYIGFAIATKPVAYAVDATNNLLIFNPEIYYSNTNLSSIISKPLTGLAMGDTVVGIDFRPLNGQLYALGANSNVYTINTSNGAATLVSSLSTALSGTHFGFDFNPLVDRIRIVSNTGQNLRYNPNDGTMIVDGNLNPGSPFISSAAYTNNFAGATSTTLYGIDSNSDQLIQVNPPNDGVVVPIGNLQVDAASANGFDIAGQSGTAYALFKLRNNRTRLYVIDLSTGRASGKSIIGSAQINGFAVGLGF